MGRQVVCLKNYESSNQVELSMFDRFPGEHFPMTDTIQSRTESLLDIVKGIQSQTIMLPEFQRDFRWELDQTYDLFDSLIRNIFIGTIIYGKPSFGMTLREIDTRPRKGKGSNARLTTVDLSQYEMSQRVQANDLRIVLDGQQRITSIYRAITGVDSVFIILHEDIKHPTIRELTLEQMLDTVAGEESRTAISIKLADAYEATVKDLREKDRLERFRQSQYAQRGLKNADEATREAAEEIYLAGVTRVIELFKREKMLSYYLLDMSLSKFTLFFERSNSRGIQLNFTDILAAKLYHGFNLRRKIEEFESENKLTLNREIIVRAIAYITGLQRGEKFSIDKGYILEKLDADDFNAHWDDTVRLYAETIDYLTRQHFILSQDWIPSENMVIPLMMFRRHLKGFNQMTEEQRQFIEFWYWASIFANRYSSASNEVIILDSAALSSIARGERIAARGFFTRMRSLVQSADDLFGYTKKSSATYRGILNLIGYHSRGLKDWNSSQWITPVMRLEDHHIYPRSYIANNPQLDMELAEANQLVDCVVNRTLIPKLLNIKIGKKAPQTYLAELARINSRLADCLVTHLIPNDMLVEPLWNKTFKMFLEERARAIFGLVEQYAIQPFHEMVERYGMATDVDASDDTSNYRKARLSDMIADGRVKTGDRVFVRKRPGEFATIVEPDGTVEYNGKRYSINSWGQEMTGWPTINIYASVLLERTSDPLDSLR